MTKVWCIHKTRQMISYDPSTKPPDVHGMIHPRILWQATTVWCIHKTRQMMTVWSIHKPRDVHGMIHPQIPWQATTVLCIHKTRQTIAVWSIHKTCDWRPQYDASAKPARWSRYDPSTKPPDVHVWSIHVSCDRRPQYDAYTKPVRWSRYDPSTNPVTGDQSTMHPQNPSDDHGMIHSQNLWQATTVWCIHKTRQMTTAAWSFIKPVSDDQSRMHPQNICQRPHRMVHPQSLCQTYPKPNSTMTLEIAQSIQLLPTVWTATESSCDYSR